MAGFVLIHGAWLGGWSFAPVAERLGAAGHLVDAPDLPGMGGDDAALAAVSLADWAGFAAERCKAMAQKQAGPVILAGHSRGGLVISEAAEQAPEAITELVYICAMMLPGGSSRAAWKAHQQGNPAFDAVILPTSGGEGTVLDKAAVPAVFAQCSPEADAIAMAESTVAEPNAARRAVLKLSPQRYGSVPRSYIACTRDRVIPLADQYVMIDRQPGTEVIEIEADHSPFLSAPDALAQALMQIAERRGG